MSVSLSLSLSEGGGRGEVLICGSKLNAFSSPFQSYVWNVWNNQFCMDHNLSLPPLNSWSGSIVDITFYVYLTMNDSLLPHILLLLLSNRYLRSSSSAASTKEGRRNSIGKRRFNKFQPSFDNQHQITLIIIIISVKVWMAPTRSPCLGPSDYVYFLREQMVRNSSNNGTSDEEDDTDNDGHHRQSSQNGGHRSMDRNGQRINGQVNNGHHHQLDCPDDLPKLSELLRNLSDDLKSGPSG